MQDLSDFYYFALVVEHGGYAAAERATGISKSRLSRRVAELEQELGARLIQRSTRKFAVTDVGQDVYRQARLILEQAQALRERVDQVTAVPRGLVRVSVPVSVAQIHMADLLGPFHRAYPDVRLQLIVTNRRVDVINEQVDLALRVRTKLDTDSELVVRTFGASNEVLVASPHYLRSHPPILEPSDLVDHPTLSNSAEESLQYWELHGPGNAVERVQLKPVIAGSDFGMLLGLAKAGVGITMLPDIVCHEAVNSGELELVLPDWNLPQGIFHVVYPSRKGVLPAVRALIDYFIEEMPKLLERQTIR